VRALKGGWTRAKLGAEVKRLTRNGAGTEAEPPEQETGAEPEPTDTGTDDARATERRGGCCSATRHATGAVPINLPQASADELRGLLGRLRTFTTDVEARLASAEGRNHR